MVCLDSDILIDYLKEKDYAVKKIQDLKNKDGVLSTTSINAFELYKGSLRTNDPNAIESLNDLLLCLKSLNFNFNCSKKAAKIFEYLRLKGELLDLADVIIAAIVITNNETLLTNNKTHFQRISGLVLE